MRDNGVVHLAPGEDAEYAAKRLKKIILKHGVLVSMKRHSFALSPGEQRRLKQKVARAKARKREKQSAEFQAEWERRRYGSGAV